jgi:hypothetical protein
MMSFVHYITALRSYKESQKTVYMMGGEHEAPPMVLAQQEMRKLEMEYYKEESIKLGIILIGLALFGLGVYNLLLQLGKL